jgi:hypothetical protein
VVAGRTVAWLEVSDNTQVIKARNVDTGNTTEVKVVLGNTSQITGLEGKGRFLVWGELDYDHSQTSTPVPGYPYTLEAYDLATGNQYQELTAYLSSGPDFALPSYSISGTRLAVSMKSKNPFLINLSTGTSIELPYTGTMQNLTLYGDKLLFSTGIEASDLYGIDLSSSDLKAVLLLQSPPNTPSQDAPRYQAAVVGDWLVWANAKDSQSRLSHKKLDLAP